MSKYGRDVRGRNPRQRYRRSREILCGIFDVRKKPVQYIYILTARIADVVASVVSPPQRRRACSTICATEGADGRPTTTTIKGIVWATTSVRGIRLDVRLS